MTRLVLRHYGGPGIWGYDSDRELWGTSSGRGPEPCALCGATITQGYRSGYRSGSRLVCLSHVTWEVTP